MHKEPNRANRVVIARYDVINAGGVAVCIDNADHRNAELARFGDGDFFMIDIDHKNDVRQTAHVLDAAKAPLKLLKVAGARQAFFLGQLVERAIACLGLQFAQSANRLADGLVVRQHAAEPALVDIGHAATLSMFLDNLAGTALGANEHHLVAPRRHATDVADRIVQCRQRLLKVDDMDIVAGTENVFAHFRIPVTGLMPEMDACFKQVAHSYTGHRYDSPIRVVLTPARHPNPKAPRMTFVGKMREFPTPVS